MNNEIVFKTQIKDLTLTTVTSTVEEKINLWIKDLPVTNESAKLIHTTFGRGFKVYCDKSVFTKIFIETFSKLDDSNIIYKPFCTIFYKVVINIPLLCIEFEQPEGLYAYNGNYQFEDYLGFFKILNNIIGTDFAVGGELL